MGDCLSDQEVLAFVEGDAADGARTRVIEHIDRCEACRQLVAAAAPPPSLTDELEGAGAGVVAADGGLAPGTHVGRFLVAGPLGQGGMGVLYRAVDERLGRPVALKLLHADRARDEMARARFLREARTASTLDHPNIGTVYEVGEHDGQPFIAMALYEGESLRARLQRGSLTVEEIASIARQLAEGLATAHAHGVIHRDLKPANVMLLPDGQVKLLDFGLAKVTSSDESSLTREGAILGTLAYMAPEQLRGSSSVDQRADLWSLGAVLYELLAGRPPFGVGPATTLIGSVLGDDPAPLPVSAPADLAAVALRLLEKPPQRRLASARMVANLLERRAAPPRPLRAQVLAALALAVVAAVALLALRLLRNGDGPGLPRSSIPEAEAEYERGLHEYTEGINTAFRTLDHAAQLDPGLAAANLKGALWTIQASNWSDALRSYRLALAHNDRLTPRERGLLGALAPALVNDPPDWATAERRLRALHDESSGDEDAAVLLSFASSELGRDEEAERLLKSFLDGHPDSAHAWFLLGRLELRNSRWKEASAAAERCMSAHPSATVCLAVGLEVDALLGRCTDTLTQARRWIAISPDDRWGYTWVAASLEALGAPRESIDEAVRLANEHQWGVPSVREGRSQLRLSAVAARYGALDAADAALVEYQRRRLPHGEFDAKIVSHRIDLAFERGDGAQAGRLAAEQLSVSRAYPAPDLAFDETPALLAAERRAGLISRVELDSAMSDWRRRFVDEKQVPTLWQLWITGAAAAVETPGDALAAVRVRPPLERLPNLYHQERIGHASLLAGRFAEAAQLLESVTANCDQLEDPIGQTRAWLDLGEAREKLGQQPGACAAYAKVVERWGKATPRSLTAEAASSAMRRLACR
jgi:eukaryotic-like serine/threonine-protein kinase